MVAHFPWEVQADSLSRLHEDWSGVVMTEMSDRGDRFGAEERRRREIEEAEAEALMVLHPAVRARLLRQSLGERWAYRIETLMETFDTYAAGSSLLDRQIDYSRTRKVFENFVFEKTNIIIRILESDPPSEQPPPFPEQAPELWDKKKQPNPAQFIFDTYQKWIGKGLTRAHLLKLDKPLYKAFSAWVQKKDNYLWYDLPTVKEANTRLVLRAAGDPGSIPLEDYAKVRAAASRRGISGKM